MNPKLLPVEVPWRIALETPDLTLIAYEQGHSEVSFIGQFLADSDEAMSLKEKKVIIEMYDVLKTRTSGKWSDSYTIDPNKYDWSEIKPEYHPYRAVSAIEKYQQEEAEYMSQWISSNNCPVPNMYRVANSEWLHSIGHVRETYIHYLFIGEDIYIEVIARGFKWESGEDIDWTKNPQ